MLAGIYKGLGFHRQKRLESSSSKATVGWFFGGGHLVFFIFIYFIFGISMNRGATFYV